MRRAVQNPVQEQVVIRTPWLPGCQRGIEPWPQQTIVMISRRFAQESAGDDVGEIDPPAHFRVKPQIIRGIADNAISIAIGI